MIFLRKIYRNKFSVAWLSKSSNFYPPVPNGTFGRAADCIFFLKRACYLSEKSAILATKFDLLAKPLFLRLVLCFTAITIDAVPEREALQLLFKAGDFFFQSGDFNFHLFRLFCHFRFKFIRVIGKFFGNAHYFRNVFHGKKYDRGK